MNCKTFRSNIAAFLAGELDERSSDEHRRHAEECSNCAAEIRSTAILVDLLKAHLNRDVPERVEAVVLKGLDPLRRLQRRTTTSPLPLRSHIQGVFTMKRRTVVVGLVAVAVAVGLAVLPGLQSNRALAGVANAIANANSIHLVIKKAHTKTGERSIEELWIKLPSQYRLRSGYGEVADNGQKTIRVHISNGVTTATISASEGLKGLDPTSSYLTLFNFRELVEKFGDKVLSRTSTRLSDGRMATIFDFGDCRFTVDDATNLPVRIEDYRSDGSLKKVIEHIEYDVEIPDTVFDLQIPKNAIVIDTLTPSASSPEVERDRSRIAAKLESSGAWKLAWRIGAPISSVYSQNSGSVASPAHPGMQFRPLEYGKAWLFYIPKRNSYFVLGKWHITDGKTAGYSLTVQDREFPAPRKPQLLAPRAPRVCVQNAKPGEYNNWTNLQNLGPGPLTIIEKHSWNGGTFYEIQGRAKHIPDGKEYKDETATFEELINRPYDLPYPTKPYWGNLPPEEIKSRKGYIDYHNRIAAFLSNKNSEGYPVYDGAKIQDMGWLDDNAPLCEGKLQLTRIHRRNLDEGDTSDYLGYALRVPAKRVFLCIGHVKVKYPGKPDRICVNGVVSFDGEILSSEE